MRPCHTHSPTLVPGIPRAKRDRMELNSDIVVLSLKLVKMA